MDDFTSTPLFYIGTVIIAIVIVLIVVYGLFDGHTRLYKIRKRKNYKKLMFSNYKEVLTNIDKYEFHAPYGTETAINTFNSETPYILEVIETCIERNRRLIQRYNNHEDPNVLNAFLQIELQLTSMIANQGISLTKRCKFYCVNSSKSFDLELDKQFVKAYIENASKLHEQFSILKREEFKSDEVIKISTSMYEEFFEFFKSVNELISYQEDKTNKVNKKEENINDKC